MNTKPMTTDQPLVEQTRLQEKAVVANHKEAPTKTAWEAFLAQRKALYVAQLEAMKPEGGSTNRGRVAAHRQT